MTKEKTLQDWQETVEALADNPGLSNLINLQKTLVTIAREELGFCERYPFAIVTDSLICSIEPWIKMKLEHLIFPDAVAKSYELASIQISNVHVMAAPGNLPLETFSIEVYAKQTPDKLLDVMKWKVPVIVPGQKMHFMFNPIVKNPPRIRGIGWAKVL
jgi:hypothetical protein